MGNFSNIKKKYLKIGIHERHIDYANKAIKNKIKRDYVFDNLTSDVRKLDPFITTEILDDIIGLDVPFYTFSPKKYKNIKSKYIGVEERHINYAFSEINKGGNPEVILENLTADNRKIKNNVAEDLLNDLSSLQGNYITFLLIFTLLGTAILFGFTGFIAIYFGFESASKIAFFAAFGSIISLIRFLYYYTKGKRKINKL